MQQAKLPPVDGFQLDIKCEGSFLWIQAEQLATGRAFSAKFDNDTSRQMSNGLFADAEKMCQGLIDAANKAYEGVQLSINHEGKMTYRVNLSLGPIKQEHMLDLHLEEQHVDGDASLEKRVKSLATEVVKIKESNETQARDFRKLIDTVEDLRNSINKNAELENKVNTLLTEMDKLKKINEEKNMELTQNLMRIEQKFFERLEKLEKRLDVDNWLDKAGPSSVSFDASSINASFYDFSNNNKTVKANSNTYYPCLQCVPHIPSTGVHKYSIRIESKANVGIVFGITKVINKKNWNASATRYWTNDGQIYDQNSSNQAGTEFGPFSSKFGSKNDVISMVVDVDKRTLTFMVNDQVVSNGQFATGIYYAYVSLANKGDCLTLL